MRRHEALEALRNALYKFKTYLLTYYRATSLREQSYLCVWASITLSDIDVMTRYNLLTLTRYGHIKTAEQRTIIQQYGDWYTGRWRVGC